MSTKSKKVLFPSSSRSNSNKKSSSKKKLQVRGHGDYDLRERQIWNSVSAEGKKKQSVSSEIKHVSAANLKHMEAAALKYNELKRLERERKRALLPNVGEAIGGVFGAPHLGKKLGGAAATVWDFFSGNGDYRSRRAAFSREAMARGLPRLSSMGNNSQGTPIHLCSSKLSVHSKPGKNWATIPDNNFVMEIVSSETDQDYIIACNPGYYPNSSGQAIPFWPMIVGTGGSYQKWYPGQCLMGYEEYCSDLALTAPLPVITIVQNTEIDDLPLVGEVALLAENLAVSIDPTKDEWIPLECDKTTFNCPAFEVRTDNIGVQTRRKRKLGDPATGSSTELRSCDPWYIQVHVPGTSVVPSGTVFGHLWQCSKLHFTERRLNPLIYNTDGILISPNSIQSAFFRGSDSYTNSGNTAQSPFLGGVASGNNGILGGGYTLSNVLPYITSANSFTWQCGDALPSVTSPPHTLVPGTYEIIMWMAVGSAHAAYLAEDSTSAYVTTSDSGTATFNPVYMGAAGYGSGGDATIYTTSSSETATGLHDIVKIWMANFTLRAVGDQVQVGIASSNFTTVTAPVACCYQLRQCIDSGNSTPSYLHLPAPMVRGLSAKRLKLTPPLLKTPKVADSTSVKIEDNPHKEDNQIQPMVVESASHAFVPSPSINGATSSHSSLVSKDDSILTNLIKSVRDNTIEEMVAKLTNKFAEMQFNSTLSRSREEMLISESKRSTPVNSVEDFETVRK